MNVIEERNRKGLRQKDLCKSVGVCKVTMSKIENGKIEGIRFGILLKVANVLEIPFEQLFLNKEVL